MISTPPASAHRLQTISVSQALARESSGSAHISTNSQRLDTLLGGHGLTKGQVAEICGPPGSGKTGLALQLTANALAAGNRVVWIDTSHLTSFSRMPAGLPLEKITHHHTPSLAHILALLLHPRVDTFPAETALVVVDSASTVFTAAFPPGMEVRGSRKSKLASARRFPIMTTLVTELGRLAAVRNCVVLVCQQMNTRIIAGYGGVLQPAVGMAAWGNGLSTRLLVYRRDDKGEGRRRWVRVVKAAGRSWKEAGPRVCVKIGEKWEDLELPEEEGRKPDPNAKAGTDEGAATPPPELIAPHAPEPQQQPSLKVQPPTSTRGRKRSWTSTRVIPDSDGEEDEELSDDENLVFGWGDDGLFDLGEKGAMDNGMEDRIKNVEAPGGVARSYH